MAPTKTKPTISTRTTIDTFLTSVLKLSNKIPASLETNRALSHHGHGNNERDRLLNQSSTGRRRRSSSSDNLTTNTSTSNLKKNIIDGDSDQVRQEFVKSIGEQFNILKERIDDGSLSREVSLSLYI